MLHIPSQDKSLFEPGLYRAINVAVGLSDLIICYLVNPVVVWSEMLEKLKRLIAESSL